MEPDISVLVVGYNSERYLRACISSVAQASEGARCEILFVNNGTDRSEALVAAEFPDVRIIPSQGNVGFAAANNLLSRHARGRWLLLLNPDAVLLPGSVDALIAAAADHPQYTALGGVTVGDDGGPDESVMVELPTASTIVRGMLGRGGLRMDFSNGDRIIPVPAMNGGFCMIERQAWARLDGLDDSFFLYAEELDFFKRLAKIGGKAGVVPSSHLRHDVGSGDPHSPIRLFYQVTGNAHYLRKHGMGYCVPLLWLSLLSRYLAASVLAPRKVRYRSMRDGLRDVALRPRRWWFGYASPGADPRSHRAVET